MYRKASGGRHWDSVDAQRRGSGAFEAMAAFAAANVDSGSNVTCNSRLERQASTAPNTLNVDRTVGSQELAANE